MTSPSAQPLGRDAAAPIGSGVPTPRRRRVTALLTAIALVIVVAVVASLVWLENEIPLTQGSSSGPGESAAYLRSEEDPFGSGVMYVYCPGASGRFAWATSIRNTGPLPVTILGSDPGPIPVEVISKTNSAWQDGLAAGQKATPSNTPLMAHDLVDAAHATLLTPSNPITIKPMDELDVWVWYRMGSGAEESGGRQAFRSVRVRFSILGLDRVADIPMRDGVGVQGTPCTTS